MSRETERAGACREQSQEPSNNGGLPIGTVDEPMPFHRARYGQPDLHPMSTVLWIDEQMV